jgi:hypothetical protein
MRKLQEVPYGIWRRSGSDGETRERLGQSHGDAASAVRYHLVLLQLEAPLAAEAYYDLWIQTRRRAPIFRAWAWSRPPIAADPEMEITAPFRYDFDAELDLAVRVVRYELQFLRSPWMRRSLRRKMIELRERRSSDPPYTFADVEDVLAQQEAKRVARAASAPQPSLSMPAEQHDDDTR